VLTRVNLKKGLVIIVFTVYREVHSRRNNWFLGVGLS
jgi:hypothetical protein